MTFGSDAAHLFSFAVARAYRRCGIGSALLAAAERYGRMRPAMVLEVREDNLAARALYRKRGYRETGRLANFYADGADTLCLKRISQPTDFGIGAIPAHHQLATESL